MIHTNTLQRLKDESFAQRDDTIRKLSDDLAALNLRFGYKGSMEGHDVSGNFPICAFTNTLAIHVPTIRCLMTHKHGNAGRSVYECREERGFLSGLGSASRLQFFSILFSELGPGKCDLPRIFFLSPVCLF
jgi:hypothetical protein